MPEPSNPGPEPRYHETSEPQNPPNSVIRPEARRSALRTYVGGIAVVFAIVAGAFAYFAMTEGRGDSELDVSEPASIGTGGAAAGETPGGFEPIPRKDSTESEIEFRGGSLAAEDAAADRADAEPLTDLGAMLEDSQAVAGRRIDLRDVEVERVDGNTFVVRDGDARATVIAAGAPDFRSGQRVDVSGTIEPGAGSARIRATAVNPR